ncbi:tyrosine-protein phosphatase [soil metagenome]
MIDLHLHVLPHVDDGARDCEESEAMLTYWSDLGFTRLVSTPHLMRELDTNYHDTVLRAFDSIRDVAVASGIELQTGFEVLLRPGLAAELDAGAPLGLGPSRSILIELPFAQWPTFTETSIFDIQAVGFRPILAHPERYEAVQREIGLVERLAERGVVLQVTHASLAGVFGRAAQRTAEALITLDAHVVIGSDAHSTGDRLTSVGRGLDRAIALVGDQRARQMTWELAKALLDDEDLPDPMNAVSMRRRERRLGRLLNRGN